MRGSLHARRAPLSQWSDLTTTQTLNVSNDIQRRTPETYRLESSQTLKDKSKKLSFAHTVCDSRANDLCG
jgi:hypothetical protein